MNKSLHVLALASVAGVCFGQFAAPIDFREAPGEMEFTGRMTVRPVQMDAWAQRGVPESVARARRQNARAAILSLAIKYVPETDEYVIRVPKGANENSLSRSLMGTGNYQYVTPDWRVYPLLIPNDTNYNLQWSHPRCQAPQGWDLFTGANTVIVALTDTGVRLDHLDLAASLVSGYNAVTNLPQANGGQVGDLNGHGTHTAGIPCAIGNNALGVCGVGWNFKLMPIRVSDSPGGGAFLSDLTEGARWAADNGARVVNTSYSGVSDPSVQTTGNYIKFTRNGFYCWAAGNNGAVMNNFDWPDVTIVGATDSADNRAGFSNYGVALDCFAPGVSILSTYFSSNNSYAYIDGTSQASPYAAGVGAMVTAANLSLPASTVETIVYQSCTDLGAPGNDNVFGWGRVNVYQALRNTYNNYWFQPTGFSILVGQLISGGVPQLRTSDNTYLHVRNVFDSTGVPLPTEVQIDSNSTNKMVNVMRFEFEVRSSISSCLLRTYLWDYVANMYALVDSRIAPTGDSTVTITPSNPARFRQGSTGNMRAKIVLGPHSTGTANGWDLFLDIARWQTTAL